MSSNLNGRCTGENRADGKRNGTRDGERARNTLVEYPAPTYCLLLLSTIVEPNKTERARVCSNHGYGTIIFPHAYRTGNSVCWYVTNEMMNAVLQTNRRRGPTGVGQHSRKILYDASNTENWSGTGKTQKANTYRTRGSRLRRPRKVFFFFLLEISCCGDGCRRGATIDNNHGTNATIPWRKKLKIIFHAL